MSSTKVKSVKYTDTEEDELCLRQQMIGDIYFKGINGPEIWIDHVCLAWHVMKLYDRR